jgi:N-acetylglutamate synthase-like GNAT family acetyltransferase
MIEIRIARHSDISQIEAFYLTLGYGGGINKKDTVFVAKANGEIVGAVRLCPEAELTVLRGMQISKAFQRQGIGTRLLDASSSHLDLRLSFCLPYSHLKGFYSSASFEPVRPIELPEFLATRLASYLARGQDVVPMRRMARNPSIEGATRK